MLLLAYVDISIYYNLNWLQTACQEDFTHKLPTEFPEARTAWVLEIHIIPSNWVNAGGCRDVTKLLCNGSCESCGWDFITHITPPNPAKTQPAKSCFGFPHCSNDVLDVGDKDQP